MSEHVDGLWLSADGLLSKWGFYDGDTPEALLDLLDERDAAYPEDWHAVLAKLVREHLLPALDQRVEVYTISTIHNPIRAVSIDGVKVADEVLFGDAPAPTLTPDGVWVSWETVLSEVTP